jgi:membrane-bound serine protease (ClpP class)
MRGMRRLAFFTLAVVLTAPAWAARAPAVRPVSLIRISGAIDVPSQEYLQRGLKQAQANGSQALLILINTPGGLAAPMKDMTEALLNAPIPTIAYVAPAGAYAMSAGTFITMAASIAAMQPNTSIGAAHPVDLFGTMPSPQPEEEQGKPAPDVMTRKVENAFAEQAKVIAQARGRNTAWAEKAVRESITASAREAVKLHVVDLLADDVGDLMTKLDGRRVTLPEKRTVVLHTAGAPVVEIAPSTKEKFLHVLADPNLLLVLLALAALGIMFELQNPGAILPGVVGGLALLLALYSMAALPVSYAGVGLILFGILLFIADIKVASHGILTVGGLISFVVGALMLTNTPVAPALQVSWQVVLVVAVLVAGFFLFVVGASVRAHLRPVQTGQEGMSRQHGRALEALRPQGEVLVGGEIWKARAVDGEIGEGDDIEVVGQDRLTLLVRKRPVSPAPPG